MQLNHVGCDSSTTWFDATETQFLIPWAYTFESNAWIVAMNWKSSSTFLLDGVHHASNECNLKFCKMLTKIQAIEQFTNTIIKYSQFICSSILLEIIGENYHMNYNNLLPKALALGPYIQVSFKLNLRGYVEFKILTEEISSGTFSSTNKPVSIKKLRKHPRNCVIFSIKSTNTLSKSAFKR